MPPPRDVSAEKTSRASAPAQSAIAIAAAISDFLSKHESAAVLEDGKVVFDMRSAKHSLSTERERCTLHLWSDEHNMVRRVVEAVERGGALRLATQRFGQTQTKLLELVASREQRTPTTRENGRTRYLKTLTRALEREFAPFVADGMRTAMDLEHSFGPAYARGSLVRGNQAWAVIGVNECETATTIDGVLTLGILWLHACRERGGGRRLYQGLKVIVPRGAAMLTLARMAWLNGDTAQWELWELDEKTEELAERDAADTGNLRTRLVQHPDERAAAERFSSAIEQVMAIVPEREQARVEQRLRSTAELAFLLHGLEFARARIGLAPNSFARTMEITVGAGAQATLLNENTRKDLAAFIAELFERRRAFVPSVDFGRRGSSPLRRIGAGGPQAAHSRMNIGGAGARGQSATQDPLYRASPERWLESMLRRDLAPLTRSLAPGVTQSDALLQDRFANEDDPDTRGNRIEIDAGQEAGPSPLAQDDKFVAAESASGTIPRLDPQHVYAQVPAIAGADDRGLLDLLGVTADGRLAVIELKAEDDLHFALQGLDYWIRVRHHHRQAPDALTGMGEFQRHGYFRGVELSPLAPRLYLVAPALHIHPATETVLRYFSPRVEWALLALDERWRQEIRVVWRKSGVRS
jgi:hypothetical protein